MIRIVAHCEDVSLGAQVHERISEEQRESRIALAWLGGEEDEERIGVEAPRGDHKYWLEVSDKEQKRRFEARITDPLRQWKLSPMDLPSRSKWFEYSRARDMMLKATDTKWAPWYILHSDDKKRARLNCITHLLSKIPHKKVPRPDIDLPKRSMKHAYDDQVTLKGRKFVPAKF